jgi:hypothetical protein
MYDHRLALDANLDFRVRSGPSPSGCCKRGNSSSKFTGSHPECQGGVAKQVPRLLRNIAHNLTIHSTVSITPCRLAREWDSVDRWTSKRGICLARQHGGLHRKVNTAFLPSTSSIRAIPDQVGLAKPLCSSDQHKRSTYAASPLGKTTCGIGIIGILAELLVSDVFTWVAQSQSSVVLGVLSALRKSILGSRDQAQTPHKSQNS